MAEACGDRHRVRFSQSKRTRLMRIKRQIEACWTRALNQASAAADEQLSSSLSQAHSKAL